MFLEFPKMARLSREVFITEKIDGTNAAVVIEDVTDPDMMELSKLDRHVLARFECHDGITTIKAQSRTRMITPDDDNYGFARWVQDNASDLINLGQGYHFGEWWGRGIQRGYGVPDKRFSLFNTGRWKTICSEAPDLTSAPGCCGVVPILYRGEFDTAHITSALAVLKAGGSVAAPGFMNPEGIVVYHTAANFYFKKTILKDEVPKSKYANSQG